MGSRAPPVRCDVNGRWQQCHAVPRSPSVRGTVATPNPRFGDKGFTVATPHHVLLKGAQTLRARGGRLLDAILPRGRLAGADRSWCCWLVVGRPLVAGRRASRPPEGRASAWGTARRSWPKVLLNPGTRVRLPVAHYSDTGRPSNAGRPTPGHSTSQKGQPTEATATGRPASTGRTTHPRPQMTERHRTTGATVKERYLRKSEDHRTSGPSRASGRPTATGHLTPVCA